MKKTILNFFGSMPLAARLLVLAYAIGWPVSLAGAKLKVFNAFDWMAFSPALLWHGEVWTAFTYAFLSGGALDWVVNLFWFATLISVLCRNWSGARLWAFCLLAAGAGALFLGLMTPRGNFFVVGNAAMIFGLLGAWWRFYRYERLILLGFGEVSVGQAALLIGAIEVLILLFSVGWLVTLAMVGGGAVAWLWLLVSSALHLKGPAAPVQSERIARLEL